MKLFLSLFLLLFPFLVDAQKTFEFGQIPMQMGDNSLSMPFAGGINSAQIQTMDTNGDGQEEWVIWDINARNILVFEKNGEAFKHLPEMSHYLPQDIQGFLLLKDFDGDGLKDLFTSSPFGIKAYQNTGIENDHPTWQVAQEYLPLENGSNIQANNLDIPALQDIDGDGDLDLVTFNYASGDYLDYFKNTSMERKGQPDMDGFAPSEVRWGEFEFCGCGNFSFGQTCDGDPIAKLKSTGENQAIEHSGGHSILLKDFNGDGLLDLVMGQDECNTLYFLANAGTNESPVFNNFSTYIPGQFPTIPYLPRSPFLSRQTNHYHQHFRNFHLSRSGFSKKPDSTGKPKWYLATSHRKVFTGKHD